MESSRIMIDGLLSQQRQKRGRAMPLGVAGLLDNKSLTRCRLSLEKAETPTACRNGQDAFAVGPFCQHGASAFATQGAGR